jgi:protein TonB
VAVPEKVEPEAGLDAAGEGGETGGVEGGIPGGVVGGIVGGLPQASSPPAPIRIEGQMKEPTKLKQVAPIYPDLAAAAGIQGAVVLECLVSPQGRVTGVKILKGIPLLNEAAVTAVKQWLYTPTLLDGVPVPVIMTVTVQFSLKGARSARAR